MTDPIADMLTQIRNAQAVHRSTVTLPHSRIKEAIARTLTDAGFITTYRVDPATPAKLLTVTLKYQGSQPSMTVLKRISKPGRRLYAKASALAPSLSGYGITIISTNKGVMTDKEARAQHLGGELLCQIW